MIRELQPGPVLVDATSVIRCVVNVVAEFHGEIIYFLFFVGSIRSCCALSPVARFRGLVFASAWFYFQIDDYARPLQVSITTELSIQTVKLFYLAFFFSLVFPLRVRLTRWVPSFQRTVLSQNAACLNGRKW